MVMDHTIISVERVIVRSVIGERSRGTIGNRLFPKGERLMVGENATVNL